MSATPRMAFNGVWPTMLVKRRLPGFEQPTADLAELIYKLESRESDYTARYQEQSLFSTGHPAVEWLKSQINQTATAFLQHAGVKRMPTWSLFGWYNVNRYGDHHAPHTHPLCYLSGTYYVRMPPTPTNADDASAHSGCISFYDPRSSANMVTFGTGPDARSSYVVRPTAGTLLMWPSPLQHYVHPNLSQEHRITISYNLTVERGSKGS